MKREEPAPSLIMVAIVLGIAFLMIYEPWNLSLRELFSKEGGFASMAMEIDLFMPSTVAHGEILPYQYPLFPWLAALAYHAGIGVDTGLRGISMLSLVLLTLVVFQTARKVGGIQCAAVAAAVMLSNLIVMQKALDGYPHLLAFLFIYLGWMLWFSEGAVKGKWNVAWTLGGLLCGLAFYTIGWIAIVYFYWPLIFMRRPLAVWTKIAKPGFYIGAAAILLFIALWATPRVLSQSDLSFRPFDLAGQFTGDYVLHLLDFPFSFFAHTLPWLLLAWPNFCAAYPPLEKNPIFSRFLRTIFFSLFFLLWISPMTETRDFMLLIPPLAVSTGINYWLLARRHGPFLSSFFRPFIFIATAMAVASLVIYCVPYHLWDSTLRRAASMVFPDGWSFIDTFRIPGILQSAVAFAIGCCLLRSRQLRRQTWIQPLGLACVCSILFWTLSQPYKSMADTTRETAWKFRAALSDVPPQTVIYKLGIAELYNLCCYLGHKVKKIKKLDELPKTDDAVYLISLDPPVTPLMQWDKLRSEKYRDNTLNLWKGTSIRRQKEQSK